MFTIDTTTARFDRASQALDCALVHARQRGEALVRNARSGALLADLRLMADGTVSVAGITANGRSMIEAWALGVPRDWICER